MASFNVENRELGPLGRTNPWPRNWVIPMTTDPSPTPQTISPTDAVEISFASRVGLLGVLEDGSTQHGQIVTIAIEYANGLVETAYQTGFIVGFQQFAPAFATAGNVTGTGDVYSGGDPYKVNNGGQKYHLERDGGWLHDFIIRWNVVDANGNTLTGATGTYVLDPQPVDPGGGGDTTKPVVTIISPAPGDELGPSVPIVFTVTDNSGLFRRILPAIRFEGPGAGNTELVHDGDEFLGGYVLQSDRQPITQGFQYTVLRDGGWPISFIPRDVETILRVFAIDRAGNEA